jgi:putative aminopeptidase FrvX
MVRLSDDRVVSRSLDNRIGAYIALESLRLLYQDRPGCDVWALAATREEVSMGGAEAATFSIRPKVAISIDVTHASDTPGADKRREGEVTIGGGPVLSRGASLNEPANRLMRQVAEQQEIPIQMQSAARNSGTDADIMFRTGRGAATVLVSIPNRYMHSPNELVSLSDVEQAARLIAAFVRAIGPETDFRP